MEYILGIDIGTASVGIAAYELDNDKDNKTTKKLLHLDSYIFKEPTEHGQSGYALKNQTRRERRMARRQTQRTQKRYKKIYLFCKQHGFYGKDGTDDCQQDVITLRAKAVSEKIPLDGLAKVLLHMAKNRGYYGDFKRATDGTVAKSIQKVEAEIQNKGVKTLGQLWYKRREDAKQERKAWRNIEKTGTYTSRKMTEEEFNLILQEQQKHHPILNDNIKIVNPCIFHDLYKAGESVPMADVLAHILLYQRPLKWDTETIGKCPFHEDELRVSRASPIFQAFRLEQTLANLRYKELNSKNEDKQKASSWQHFSAEQLHALRLLLNQQKEASWSKVYATLKLDDKEVKINFDRRPSEDKPLSGNVTNYNMKTLKLTDKWEALNEQDKELAMAIVANISDPEALILPEMVDCENLEELVLEGSEKYSLPIANLEQVMTFIQAIANHKKLGTVTQMGFTAGRASYGHTTLKELIALMQDGLAPDEATEALRKKYNKSVKQDAHLELLDPLAQYLQGDDLRNPVVKKSLEEFRVSFNHAIRKCNKQGGKLTRVVIEMSRDMKQSISDRSEDEREMGKRRAMNQRILKELEKHGRALVGKTDILRYRLYTEQWHQCAYCGKKFGLNEIFGYNAEIDHIIPRSKGGTNRQFNLALVCRECNQKKTNLTPFQAYESHIFSDSQWASIMSLAKSWIPDDKHTQLEEDKYKAKKGKNYDNQMRAILLVSKKIPEERTNTFNDSQNQETAWVGRIVRDWVGTVCEDVRVTRGSITAHLRQIWGVDQILPELRRQEGKPLLNEDKGLITEQEYKAFISKRDEVTKQELETRHYLHKFDKRCDQRHHAIDAAVIAQSTTSILQRATDHRKKYDSLWKTTLYFPASYYNAHKDEYKAYREDYFTSKAGKQWVKIKVEKFNPGKPHNNFVLNLKQALLHYTVWSKPDRFASGSFFQENPSGYRTFNDEPALTQRITLRDLYDKCCKMKAKQKDIESDQDITENHLKVFFHYIIGDNLRTYLIGKVKERLNEGMSFQEALLGKGVSLEENTDGTDEDKIESFLPDGRQDGIYFPENTQNRLHKLYYWQGNYNPIQHKSVIYGEKEKQRAIWVANNYAALKANVETKSWKFISQADFEQEVYQYESPNKDSKQKRVYKGGTFKQNEIIFFKSQMIFHTESKQFYIITGLNRAHNYIEAILTNEDYSAFSKAIAQTGYVHTKNKRAGVTFTKSVIPILIPVHSREDMVRIKKEYGIA